jgi:hypothetical protein
MRRSNERLELLLAIGGFCYKLAYNVCCIYILMEVVGFEEVGVGGASETLYH